MSLTLLIILAQMLQEPGPYPLIATPPEGGYKVVNGEYASSMGSDGQWQAPEISTEHFRVDLDTVALLYGRHFVGRVSTRKNVLVMFEWFLTESLYLYRSHH